MRGIYHKQSHNRRRCLQSQSEPPPHHPHHRPSSPSPVSSLLNRTTHHGNKSSLSRTFIPVIVPMAVVVLLLTITIYMGQRKYSPTTRGEECQTEEEMARMGFMQYDFDTIRIGTDKFSDENKVGEGGFGAVYKGKLPNGRIVAVKRLSQASRQGDVEFKNEVVLLSKLRHRNLVKLLGFSFKENEELLIYEFLQNASLQKFIFDPLKPGGLDWTTRYKIIEGITRGLVYLHEDSRIKIVHQNLKAHNILLDAEMNAKISDSGIARLFALEQTQDDTCTIIGNVGCMAPEYIRYGHLSSKSNVFSYGVLVLEIVTGHKENYQTVSNIENTKYPLISYARRNWREGRTLLNIVDPTIEIQSETTMNEVTKCIHIGLLCTQEDVDERPKMTDVLLMLKSDLADFPNPSQPSFFMSTIS
ncbi:cysteine-rich receptor-like protein kinase 44 isoform X4 [Cucumis melo]|uniref:Cysteine-rich receptor-like protein kinase 44 isoform X4 n=1 Tax=Cucumis melo TaxID=3656 RepID=A0A1S4DS88_CUCME|nr:cysteine-rich receptor-like protein kinase 44 isoform X4 [Cucumis melo]